MMIHKILLLLLSLIIFTGCSTDTTIIYTNLGNLETQQKLTSLLKDASLPNKDIDQFLLYVNDFNKHAQNLVAKYQEMHNEKVDYQSLEIDPALNSGEQSDLDSLIPAFTLSNEIISTNQSGTLEDPYLINDIALFNSNDNYSLTPATLSEFVTIFNTISVSGIKNNEISHINQIEKTFNDRAFTIKEDQPVSLITLWLHVSKEDIRYVSHSGVLIDNNGLYFIEKYDYLYPYQVTKFNDRKQLKTYLLNRDDLKGDINDGMPLIFENNKYLDK